MLKLARKVISVTALIKHDDKINKISHVLHESCNSILFTSKRASLNQNLHYFPITFTVLMFWGFVSKGSSIPV